MAKAKMDEAKKTIWPAFEREAQAIGAELEKSVTADGCVSPDDLDANGMTLLQSGIMTAEDYGAMLRKYDENPTMLRMLSKYALEAAGKEVNIADRAVLYAVGNEAKSGRSEVLRNWDMLLSAALTCCGITGVGTGYNPRMGEYWEIGDPKNFVENF